MKVPLSVQAVAALELRKRKGALKDELHDEDGSPIGIQRYCKLVSPRWNWDWPHLVYIDGILDRGLHWFIMRR